MKPRQAQSYGQADEFEGEKVPLARPFVWHARARVLDLLFFLTGSNSATPLIRALGQRRRSPPPAKPASKDLVAFARQRIRILTRGGGSDCLDQKVSPFSGPKSVDAEGIGLGI